MLDQTLNMATIAHSHCEDCFTGVKHSGDPVGKTVTIADVPTYVSEPTTSVAGPKKVVIFFADVYGPFYLNNQLLQDYFASHGSSIDSASCILWVNSDWLWLGFTVLGIDYFLGDPVHIHTEEGFDRNAWIDKSRAKANEITPKWLEEIRKQYGPCCSF